MKQNKLIITAAVILILTIVLFMAYDFFVGFNSSDKNVYEYNLDHLSKVEPSLINYSEVQQIKPEIEVLRAVAVNENDDIYITGKDKVLIFDKKGQLQKEIVTDYQAFCIAVNEQKEIFVGQRKQIDIYDSTGVLKDSWIINNGNPVVTSIAVSETSVFIADAGNKIVYHYDLEGNMINEIGRKDSLQGIKGFLIPSPYFDLAIGREDELWVVNPGRHQLEAYTISGRFLSSWNKTSMGLDGFSGCCNPSHIAILPNGSFVTSEKGIIRVKIHNPSGEFESVVAAPKVFDKGTKGLDLAIDSQNRIIVIDPKKGLVRIFEKNKG